MDKRFNLKRSDPAAPAAGAAIADGTRARQEPQEAAESGATGLEQLVSAAVERALAERLKLFERDAQERAAQARSEGRAEAERLAGMSADERLRYEGEAQREREAELDRREAELKRRELRAYAADALVARGLPGELGQFVDCADAERCQQSIDALAKAFCAAVQAAVDARLDRGTSLPRSGGDPQAGMIGRMRAAAGLNKN